MERRLGNLVASQRLLRKALRIDPENAAALMVKISPKVNQVSKVVPLNFVVLRP